MKKIVIISLLVLFIVAVTGIAAAEEETTYYCYDYSTQQWRVCTPSEAILAKDALEKEIPKEVSHEEWEAVINSNQPYWQYYLDPPTPTPTSTPGPTPVPPSQPSSAEEETTYYCYDYSTQQWRVCTPSEAILARDALKREIPKEVSHEEWEAVINSNQPYWQYYLDPPTPAPTSIPAPVVSPTTQPSPRPTLSDRFKESIFTPWFPMSSTPTPAPTPVPSIEVTNSPDFEKSFFSSLFTTRNFTLPFKWF